MLKIKNNIVEIDDNGYIEKYEIENIILSSVSLLYEEAVLFNRKVYTIYDKLKLQQDDRVSFFYLATLERIHKDYQGILILLGRGLQSQARSVLRNLLEKLFILKAVEKNNANLDSWVKTQNRERNSTIRIIKTGHTIFSEEEINKLNLDESNDIERVSFKVWAERADMGFDYNIYHILCSDTHHSMSGIDRDAFATDNDSLGLILAPIFDDVDYFVALTMHYLLVAVDLVKNRFGFEVEWIKEYHLKLIELGIEEKRF